MRNLFSFFALMISLVGVGISLTREEIRCWVGLPSNSCQSSLPAPPASPASPPTAAPKATQENSEATEAAAPDGNAANATSKPVSEVAPAVVQEAATRASQTQEASQPIEVIPPAAESSQPIEVIPPPAASNP